jgi:hypothetical protein
LRSVLVGKGGTIELGKIWFASLLLKVTIPDFHATILHLLGLDHSRLAFRHPGRDYRPTHLHGTVVKEIPA